jgi:hypothetical protein
MPELTFSIYPENQDASLDLFLRSMRSIQRFIQDVDYAVTRERTQRRWIIAGLHSSAPTVALRPLLGDLETIDVIGKGLRHIASGNDDPPEFFTEDALNDLKRMRPLFTGRDRAKHIMVSVDHTETAIIQDDISEKAQRILVGGYHNLGSLEGDLDIINVHRTATFTIWDRASRAPVHCYFPKSDEWIDKIKSVLQKRVVVRGVIRYFANGVPRTITDIVSVEDATPNHNLPPGDFGSIPDAEAARDPVAFLRVRRGFDKE